jgi:hypothetical protein
MTLIYFLVGAALLIYVGTPLLIRTTLKINARPGMTPITPTYLADDAREFFDACAPRLEALNFERTDVFTVEQATPGVTSHVALWINRTAGQAAAVTVMIASKGEKPNQVKRYVEFLTRVEDGVSVTTNNSADLGAFKTTAASDTLSAQRLQDVANLYRLHVWREAQLAGSAAPRVLPSRGHELAWFAEMLEESIQRQLGTGYLQLAPGEEKIYVPTMHGAYLMTWSELPPMKGMRRSREDKRANDQIRQAARVPAGTPPKNARVVTLAPPAGADGGGHNTPPMRKVA